MRILFLFTDNDAVLNCNSSSRSCPVCLCNLEIYQQRMASAFNKRVRLRSFKKGDLVLMVRTPIIINRRTGGEVRA